MTEPAEERTIGTASGGIAARVTVKDGVLDGLCEWYDSRGRPVARGSFERGVPHTGTFLNWASYFSDFNGRAPYDAEIYCRDWITIFEAGFFSQSPQYELVSEHYRDGRKIAPTA